MNKKPIMIGIVSLFVIGELIGFFSIVSDEVDAPGPTYIGGILSENTIWTIEDSPYIVTNNVLVEENVNLTIQPGVHVKFNTEKYLRVDGTLFAVGTESMMIIFTSNNSSPAPGDWGGLRFENPSNNSFLKFCKVEYGGGHRGGGIKNNADNLKISYCTIINNSATGPGGGIYNSGSIIIDYSTIFGNFANDPGGGIYNDHAGSIIVSGGIIKENNASDNGGGIYNTGTLIINYTIITRNTALSDRKSGGGIFNYGSMDINFCNITKNSALSQGGGLWIAGSTTIDYCMISENSASSGGGIFYSGTSTTIKNSDIIKNFATLGGGIYDSDGGSLIIHDSNINNSNYNIYLAMEGVDPSYDVNATNNWWETTDTDLINLSIHDFYDDFDLGKVLYIPFRTSRVNISNQQTSTPTTPIGPTSGITNTSYTYSTSAIDPFSDQIKYGWDWDGDGTVDEWSSYIESGITDERQHIWLAEGTYNIKVKAVDEYGEESEWSDVLIVCITEESIDSDTDENNDTIDFTFIFVIIVIIIIVGIVIYIFKKK